MAVRAQFTLKGLDEYLEKIAQAGLDVDEAVGEALEESGDLLLDEMDQRVPKDTRNLERHLVRTTRQRDGNFTFVEVGISRSADADTVRYGNAQEYGYQRGGRFHAPQSYIRTSFDAKRAAVRRKQREVLKAKGFVD